MVKALSIEVQDINKTVKLLKKSSVKIGQKVEKGIANATFFMQGEVKQSIAGRKAEPSSVDTGRFLNSVEAKVSKLEGAVLSQLQYAKYLEFGTTRIVARKHFRNSLNRNKKKIQSIIKSQIK